MKNKNLFAQKTEIISLKLRSQSLKSWDLTPSQACDAELLLSGGFAPLTGFMSESETQSVIASEDWLGHYWPAPIVLDVTREFADDLIAGETIALRDEEGVLIALMEVSSLFDLSRLVDVVGDINPVAIGGSLTGIESPVHYDFKRLRWSPDELNDHFQKLGWSRIMGYITRRPLHQREVNQVYNAARNAEANILIAPATGLVRPEDSHHYARVHAYEYVLKHFPVHSTDLCLVPLYSRANPVLDALLHAIVLKNSGCTEVLIDNEFILESDKDEFLRDLSLGLQKLDIPLIKNDPMIYSDKRGGYVYFKELAKDEPGERLSDEDFDKRLKRGLEIPDWFSWPDVVDAMLKVCKPPGELGLTVFFTGLSGSGKSSIANALLVKMMEMGGRPITLLDGDIVRQNLSSELGFSKEHRNLNIKRIGYVASEITKHGGMAICAPIAPYRETRRNVRQMIEAAGGFVEIYVSTSLEECERRDRKGLYAKARAGIIKEFTGISDPYEEPENPELRIDTEGSTPEEGAQKVLLMLEKLGYVTAVSDGS